MITYFFNIWLLYIGDRGDSGSPVYEYTSESKYTSGVVPIDLILQKIYEKEYINFDLLVDEENVDEENADEENDN